MAQLYSFGASDAKSDIRFNYQFLVCLFAPDLVWQDVGDLHPNYLQTLKADNRERERERERPALAYESLLICISRVLKLILGDTSCAHRLLHDKLGYSTVLKLCMFSIACPNV